MVRDVLAGGSPTTPSVGVTSFPPPFETSTISMVMEDVVKIDPGNLSVWWEIESSGTDYMSSSVVVKGLLKNHISFWREVIKAPVMIISTIEGGYVLPLKSEPTPHVHGNHQPACKNSLFIQESLSELCTTGCAVEVSARPIICSPLSVVENSSGKKRLVINLRHLNHFLWKQRFKYEDLRCSLLTLSLAITMLILPKSIGSIWGSHGNPGFMFLRFSRLASRRHAIYSPSWCAPWGGTGGRGASEKSGGRAWEILSHDQRHATSPIH